jgi:hypothetical protein
MNPVEIHNLASWGEFICLLGILINLSQMKKRGKTAVVLACGFLVFGLMIMVVLMEAPVAFVFPLGIVLVLLLLYHALLHFQKVGGRP